ncbi:MAG: hypothetical protein ABFD08_05690 [Syntrophomonas sp.]
MRRCQDGKEPRDAQGRANAATFMDELVQRCQDGKELPVAGRKGAALRLVLQKFSSTSNSQN